MDRNDKLSISVAMAVYNGEKYINKQIDSILSQLRDIDELIISYNASSDNTWKIIKKYEREDSRVHCIDCNEKGVLANFENAIRNTKGDIICLSDQDDIWSENKVKTIIEYFEKNNCDLILHDYTLIDKSGNGENLSLFGFRNAKKGLVKNIVKNCYQGCCMAFRKELCNIFLPFPPHISMHDQWIGLCAELSGEVHFIKEPLIFYRRHDNNTSRRMGYIEKIKSILYLCWYLCKRNYEYVKR